MLNYYPQSAQSMPPNQPVPLNSQNSSGSSKNRIIFPIVSIIVVALAVIGIIFFVIQKNGGLQSDSNGNQPTTGMPELVQDQILVGYDNKYFFVADTMNDTVRNAANSFQLNFDDKDSGYKKLTDIDAYLNEPTSRSYEDGVAYEKPPTIYRNLIYSIYPLMDDTIERDPPFPRGDFLPVVTITCTVNEFDFVLEGQTYTCLKTTEPEIEKYFGEIDIEEQALGLPKATVLHKNHWINFYFIGDVIDSVEIIPLKNQEKKEAKYLLELEKNKPSPSESIKINLRANTFVITKNLGNYLYNIHKEGCEIYDLLTAKKEAITDIYDFLEQPAKDNKAKISIKCDESIYLYVYGYTNQATSNLKIKDLNAYTQTLLGIGSGFFSLDDKYQIKHTVTTRKEFEKMFVDDQVVENTPYTYTVKYKDFFVEAFFDEIVSDEPVLLQLTIYGGDLPTK